MTSINLDTLSLSELKSLQKDIAKAIAEFFDRKKTEAMADSRPTPRRWASALQS